MPRTLFTSLGTPVEVGRELGKGGEGSVFELPAISGQVAKLYHTEPKVEKRAKLTFMASAVDQKLLDYAAWPQETLHASRSGPVVGFLMPKVTSRDPIHMLYSPAHRKQERPKAAWDFLLYAARNTAAAFEVLHSHGHVLGDVNQGNVMVGSDSKVVLIDCDSFQVDARGTLHLCEVGVSHYTPPELQGLASFDGVVRSPNHDNFGLALLIFHLLFGGRHPYSGVPLNPGVGDALETDIKAFRYAYARDSRARGIAPPPRSIPMSIVPDAMETMFQLAFTERGAQGARPTSQQWVASLDALRSHLKKCGTATLHVYPDHLTACPWCALDQQGVVYFVDLGTVFKPTASGFVLVKTWALIEAVYAPPPVKIPSIRTDNATATPLPPGVPTRKTIIFYQIFVVVLAVSFIALASNLWVFGVLACIAGLVGANNAGSAKRKAERRRRQLAQDAARHDFDRLVERARKEAGPEGFYAKRAELSKLRDEYQNLAQNEKHELDKLQSTAYDRQKQKFLDSIFIDSASIPGVGPARKAALRSFGIETAADVDFNRVRQVRGFGDGLTTAVVDWKRACERRFTFNAASAVSDADRNVILTKYGIRRVALEAVLGTGASELQRLKQAAAMKASSLDTQLERAAEELSQAIADLSIS